MQDGKKTEFQFAGGKTRVRRQGDLPGEDSEVTVERLGWGGGPGHLGPRVPKPGAPGLTVGGRGGAKSVLLKAGTEGATSPQGAWQRGGREPRCSDLGLKAGRLFRRLNPPAGCLGSSSQHRLLPPARAAARGGAAASAHSWGSGCPPPPAPPVSCPSLALGSRECLTALDLISNPLTLPRRAWVPGNVAACPPPPPPAPGPPAPRGPPAFAALPGLCPAPPGPPPRAQPPPLLAFFTWLCKREGARRRGQSCPVCPPGRGPRPGPRAAAASRGRGPPSRVGGERCGTEGRDPAPPPLPPLPPPRPRGSAHPDLPPGGLRSPRSQRGWSPGTGISPDVSFLHRGRWTVRG